MGLLDRIQFKERISSPPQSIDVNERNELVIAWADGKVSVVTSLELRDACPCAGCIEEGTGRKILDRVTLPADIRPLRLEPVGNYAIQIQWSDGHGSGIYTWETLRAVCGG
jgi:DUF971 family protein